MATTRRHSIRSWLTLAVFAGALLATGVAPACVSGRAEGAGCCPGLAPPCACCTGLSDAPTDHTSGDRVEWHGPRATLSAGHPAGPCVCLPQSPIAPAQKPGHRAEDSRPDPGAGLRFEPSLGGDAAPPTLTGTPRAGGQSSRTPLYLRNSRLLI